MDIVERMQRDLDIGCSASIGDTKKAIAEIERLREALRMICDGPRDVEKTYAELFVDVKIEARKALKLIDGAGIPWVPKKRDEPETLGEKE